MKKKIINALQKVVNLSKEGAMSCSYTNDLISFNFSITGELQLEIKETDNSISLSYFNEITNAPVELRFKADDIAAIYYFEAGSREECNVPSAMIKFKDGAECDLYQDVA